MIFSPTSRHSWMRELLVLPSIAVAVLALYGGALDNWWCCDDTQILKHAINHQPYEYFFVPEAWRELIIYSLTPWLTFTFDVDHALFGLDPAGFYAHNLIAIALCAFLIYLIARQWVDGWHAAGGALFFLAGSPVAVASQQLMVRHYIEGLVFYLFALFLFIRGIRSVRPYYGWTAGIAFAIAASAKEIYLPLGFVPFLLPVSNFRQRVGMALPFLLVMLLYVPWRWYMLGDVVGGYTPAGELTRGDFGNAVRQFANIPGLLLTAPGVWLAGVVLVTPLILARNGNRWWMRLLLLVTPILLLAPLVPLARLPGLGTGSDRYFIAFWAAVTLGIAIALGRLARYRAAWVRSLSLLILAALATAAYSKARQVLGDLVPTLVEQHAQGIALASGGERDILYLTPAMPSWHVTGIIDLRNAMGKTEPSPLLVTDEMELAGVSLLNRRVLRYDPVTHALADITGQIPSIMAQWRKKLRASPLSVEMQYDGKMRTLGWQLGPDEVGSYVLLSNGGGTRVPSRGALRMDKRPDGCFRFRYDAPDGWIAYTPPLSLPPNGTQGLSRLSWKGEGERFAGAAQPPCRLEARQ